MSEADMKERADLQQLIYRNPDQFFQTECNEDVFVLNQEVIPSDRVGDRIDILAVDSKGKTVVIELKRGSDKLQLLQAISYAAMVSDLTWEEVKSRATRPG
jgi:RecB family endonuclease NucS